MPDNSVPENKRVVVWFCSHWNFGAMKKGLVIFELERDVVAQTR